MHRAAERWSTKREEGSGKGAGGMALCVSLIRIIKKSHEHRSDYRLLFPTCPLNLGIFPQLGLEEANRLLLSTC